MASKLTDESVLTVPITPEGDPKASNWAGDTEVGGFGVRAYGTGRRVYVFRFRTAQGRHRAMTIGAVSEWTTEEAREWARLMKLEVAKGRDPCSRRDDEAVVIVRTGSGSKRGTTRLYAKLPGHLTINEIIVLLRKQERASP